MQRAALSYLTRELGRDDLPCRLEVLAIDGGWTVSEGQIPPARTEV